MNKGIAIGLLLLTAVAFVIAKDVKPAENQVQDAKNMTFGQCVSQAADAKNTCYESAETKRQSCMDAAKNQSKDAQRSCSNDYKKAKDTCKKEFKAAKTGCNQYKHNWLDSVKASFK
jgi:cell fate regulator YaaT (PSP1 superfamily)